MSVAEQIEKFKISLPEDVCLVAVSKTHPPELIMQAYAAGQRVFGENKVQELCDKYEALPKDIEWHMIGHLQSNKVKYIAPFVQLIHGVDSFKLLQEINKRAAQNDRIIDCLLQFHIATEESKFGFDLAEAQAMLSGEAFEALKHIRIRGVMGMATFTDNSEQVKEEFRSLKKIQKALSNGFFEGNNHFDICSMGMSGDYLLAIEEGSNMIRVGSAIFGHR